MLENFGKTYVFPGSVEEIVEKGRGVIATREIKKDEIVAIYPGRLITQAEIIESYKTCKYIFNFQDQRLSHHGLLSLSESLTWGCSSTIEHPT